MKRTLILSVTYANGTGINGKGKFWAHSYLNNTEIEQKDNESIHDTIKRAIEECDLAEMSYNGKPMSDMFVDTENGEAKQVGYVYRVRHYIADRSSGFSGTAVFDAWVKIKEVKELKF